MRKDVIIEQWFAANKVDFNNGMVFKNLKPMIESIADFYTEKSAVVSRESVISFFNEMNVFDICVFFEDYIGSAKKELEFKDIVEPILSTSTNKRRIRAYGEINHMRKPKVFTTNGTTTKDRSVLGVADLFKLSEDVPSNPEEYYAIHIPYLITEEDGNYKPLWIKRMDRDLKINRRLRASYVAYYDTKFGEANKATPAQVSICNGELYVQRYM